MRPSRARFASASSIAAWATSGFSGCLLAVGLQASEPSPPALSVESLRTHVEFLAHDRLQGRGPGGRGIEAAASYIATRFEEAGLEPLGDGNTFFQDFAVTSGVRPAGTNDLIIAGHNLEFESDWQSYGYSQTGTLSAPLVFAGYGIRAPEYGYDDYEDLDVRDKIVLVLALEPGQRDSTSAFAGTLMTPHANLRTKAIHAREQGAIGMLVVVGPLSGEEDRLGRLRPDAGYYSTGILCGQVRRGALERAVRKLDLEKLQRRIDEAGTPQPAGLGEADVHWSIGLEKQRTTLRNVLGGLSGINPHRAIVIGAHYDHLGMGGPGSLAPDSKQPHNGADDNASGVAALIELARHHGDLTRPEVSLIFAAFSGEELGLAGSDHYVKKPAFPLDLTAAMLNLDMVGRLRSDRLLILGVESAEEFRNILETTNEAGPRFRLQLSEDGYGPSDQMSFYKNNIPVLHFFTGAHSDYHRPGDDAELLNYEGLSRLAWFVTDLIGSFQQGSLTFAQAASVSSTSQGRAGASAFRSYLGTIPDYAQDEELEGVLLTGVRPGAPAETAGLRGGDRIVQIDAITIRNIYDFVHVLRTHRPNDRILITFIRDDERLTVQAVLGHPR